MTDRFCLPACALAAAAAFGTVAWADAPARAAIKGFAETCFSPFLTAERAAAAFAAPEIRHDFYDLAPFSDVAPSPAATDVTPGTDRRCEVAFDGGYGVQAAQGAGDGLAAEGIRRDAPLPSSHADARLPGTTLLAARFLNPARVAVVHTGTRPGPNGPETFLLVERLTPQASAEVTR
ncbi:MAG: succinyl-CoA synthetase subunit beta [Pseudomonadota bacterium]